MRRGPDQCHRCHVKLGPNDGPTCERCLAKRRAWDKARRAVPEAPQSHTRARFPAPAIEANLRALATEADAIGLRGSAQRLREHADALREDPSDDRVREVGRLVAEACVRARDEIGNDGRTVYLLWRRALPAGVTVPGDGRAA